MTFILGAFIFFLSFFFFSVSFERSRFALFLLVVFACFKQKDEQHIGHLTGARALFVRVNSPPLLLLPQKSLSQTVYLLVMFSADIGTVYFE